ncbi:four helix bundle protein [Sphaerospermopsis sp. FACHB-1094]|nr:four helix bundle protein [Sphaerospermopsis sp. FACHB-1094]
MDKEEEPRRIKTHEDLVIYQKAFNAAMIIFELSKQFPAEERYSLTDQIRRSSRSVCANFAEAWRKRRYVKSDGWQWHKTRLTDPKRAFIFHH